MMGMEWREGRGRHTAITKLYTRDETEGGGKST